MSDLRPVNTSELIDQQTRAPFQVAPTGTLQIGELIRLIGGNFEGTVVDTNIWTTSVANGGTVTQLNGELFLNTNTTANGTARIQTRNRARFVTATFNLAHLAIQNDNFSNANVTRRWGLFDPVTPISSGDGVYFENTGGVVTLNRLRGGSVVETVSEGSFNGASLTGIPTNTFTKDNDVHIYELMMNAGRILWFQDRKLIHDMSSVSSAAYNTVHLTLGMSCFNINGNTTANTLKSRGFSCSRMSTSTANPERVRITSSGSGVIKRGPGNLNRIVMVDVGVGGATLSLFDNITSSGTPILSASLTDSQNFLDFGFIFNNALSYSATGTGFEVLVVFD